MKSSFALEPHAASDSFVPGPMDDLLTKKQQRILDEIVHEQVKRRALAVSGRAVRVSLKDALDGPEFNRELTMLVPDYVSKNGEAPEDQLGVTIEGLRKSAVAGPASRIIEDLLSYLRQRLDQDPEFPAYTMNELRNTSVVKSDTDDPIVNLVVPLFGLGHPTETDGTWKRPRDIEDFANLFTYLDLVYYRQAKPFYPYTFTHTNPSDASGRREALEKYRAALLAWQKDASKANKDEILRNAQTAINVVRALGISREVTVTLDEGYTSVDPLLTAFLPFLDRAGKSLIAHALELVGEGLSRLDPEAHSTQTEASITPSNKNGRNEEYFGEWVLSEGKLGQGGQGVVVPVWHPKRHLKGGLKRPAGHRGRTDKGKERFLREVDALRSIRHPFIAEVLDAGITPEPFLVTEFAQFGSLADCRNAFRGDPWRVLRLVRDVAVGLREAHELKVIHRDIKPANILLSSLDHPLVADFGIAHFDDKRSLTSTGEHVGTSLFAPREYETGDEPTSAFDVFSLGCVLYWALSGDDVQVPYRSRKGRKPLVDTVGERRGHSTDRLVDRMLAETATAWCIFNQPK